VHGGAGRQCRPVPGHGRLGTNLEFNRSQHAYRLARNGLNRDSQRSANGWAHCRYAGARGGVATDMRSYCSMTDPEHVPLLIAGAGPIGLACAISAQRRGIRHLVVDAGAIAASIVRYPVGMTFFTTPERLEIGGHPLTCAGAKATREEALKYYRGVVRADGLNVRTYTRLLGAQRRARSRHHRR